jgi:two-component system CheB/CheR fusion protein
LDQPWLQGVVGMLQQPVVLLDQFHRVVAANKSFYQLVGATPQSATGRILREVGNGLLNVPRLQDFLDLAEAGSARANRYPLELDNGLSDRRTFALSAQRIPAALASGTMVIAIEEINRSTPEGDGVRPRAQQPHQYMLPSIAADHDLRQPLQTLSLLRGVLAAREKDPELLKLIARLEEAIEALAGMLNAATSIEQLKAGPVAPEFTVFPIDMLMKRLRTELAYHAAARGIEWQVVPCSVAVRSDSQLLGQVLRALLIRAMKLIKRGKVLFGCRRHGGKLVFQIWLRGTGVSAERQMAILDEFHDGSSMSAVETLVKPLSELLDLAVKARSRPGNGLVFTAEVPIDAHFARTAIWRSGASKGTVLVASEDTAVRDALVLLLRELGHQTVTTTAEDGFTALTTHKVGSMPPEVVIIDLGEPNERSGRIVSSLRWTLGREIPVIALVDAAAGEWLADAIGEPCVYLPKPVGLAELVPQITRFLALVRHRAAASNRHSQHALSQTVFVVDDDGVLRDAVREVLGLQGQKVELFSSSEDFLKAYIRDQRGCLVIDNKLPGMDGVELLERLKSEGSTLPSIMITGHGDTTTAVRALKAGAIDYIDKPMSYEALLSAVERALEIDRGSADALIRRRELAARIAELTPRERQVLDLVVGGYSSKKIAQILDISQRTVENHRAAIMRRAGAASLPDLIRIVMQLRSS